MKNLNYLSLGAAVMAFGSCSNSTSDTKAEKKTGEKPNIIVIFADDMGYGDVGCYGHPTIKTPNLDKMADEGMRFTQFYVAASICSPSRGALMTGRYPVRTGLHTGVFFPNSEGGIPAEEITMAEALKEQGYATACFGKWHLGHLEQFLPTNNGFDEYFGLPYSNDMWSQRGKKFPPLPLIDGTKTIEEEPDQRYLTKRYTEKAIDFINRKKDENFFVYLPYAMPHVPLFASENFEGKSERGLYGDVIEEIDWSVGQIMEALKNAGVAENTFVFFTSDNGPWKVKELEAGSAGPLRGGKFTCWEGGMREPGIAWWPGTIKAGQTTSAVASTLDLYATAIALSGAELPKKHDIDGFDMTPLLKGEKESVRDEFFYYRGDILYAVRKGPWKMHLATFENPYTKDSYFSDLESKPLLYNLSEDPGEEFDQAEENPDIVSELRAIAQRQLSSFVVKPSIINPPKKK